MNRTAAMEILRNHGWLAAQPDVFRERMLAACDLLRFKRGQRIFDIGDDTGGIYGIAAGRLELHVPSSEGAPTLAHIGTVGLWVGDLAAVRGKPRVISLVAASDAEVLRLSRASMLRIVEEHPTAWLQFAELLAMNFGLSLNVIGALRRDRRSERVAAVLLNLVNLDDPHPLTVPGSQTDIGAIANLGRTSVNLALAELETLGLVRCKYAAIEILDVARLRVFRDACTGENE